MQMNHHIGMLHIYMHLIDFMPFVYVASVNFAMNRLHKYCRRKQKEETPTKEIVPAETTHFNLRHTN